MLSPGKWWGHRPGVFSGWLAAAGSQDTTHARAHTHTHTSSHTDGSGHDSDGGGLCAQEQLPGGQAGGDGCQGRTPDGAQAL
eukprot:1155635-Pelagomonas_calceolata.AAC.12